jgi:hypothetical protein
MIVLILAGILGYVFLARVFYNLLFEYVKGRYYPIRLRGTNLFAGKDIPPIEFLVSIFPVIIVIVLVYLICKLPIKLADFICNPANYKFKIRIETNPDESSVKIERK